jgi:hypothetical protein
VLLASLLAGLAFGRQTPTTWPFVHPADPFKGTALLDLRYLNEKTAGESGFVRLSPDGGGFVLGNGKPARFWAVVSDAYRLPPEQMAEHARFLAKLGVNMVRLHTQICAKNDGSKIDDVDQHEIDGIWRCVAALKKEGIYATISPYWANDKAATNWGIDGYGHEGLWGLLFFNDRLQSAYKTWVKALYAPPNPYTGIPLAQDPAVGIIQVQNEDGMFFWTMQGIKPPQLAILGRKFGQWLLAKYGSLDAAKRAWDGVGMDTDRFADGVVGIEQIWQLIQNLSGGLEKRVDDQTEFFADVQRKFYTDIGNYYRNTLGCRQLINASNWITADPIKLNDIERWTYTANDVLAVNKYTGGVHIGPNDGWRIDPGDHFTKESCLLDPRALPTNLKQVAGHPIVITESTWVSPEEYQAEGPFLTAAYESLTGVAGFYFFATGDGPEYNPDPYFNFVNINGQHALQKWTCSTPMLMGMFPANALTYRLGYLKESAPVVHEYRPVKTLRLRETPIIAEDRTFDPNRDTGNSRGQSNLTRGIDPLAFLAGKVQISYDGAESDDKVVNLAPLIDHAAKVVRGATKQVSLDYGKGICTVDSPCAQGAAGFLSRVPVIRLADASIRCANAYATVNLVSMDQRPLTESHQILVQIGTTAHPTGWQERPAEFKSGDGKQSFQGFEVVNTGAMPWQIDSANVTITLKNSAIVRATVLDPSGYPTGQVPVTRSNGKAIVHLPRNAMYVLLRPISW